MCSHSECRSPVINTVCRRRRAPPGPRQRSTLSEWHKLKERFKLTTHCGCVSRVKPAPLAGADQTVGITTSACFQDRDVLGSWPARGLSSLPAVRLFLLHSLAPLKRLWSRRLADLTGSVLLFAHGRKTAPPSREDKVQ